MKKNKLFIILGICCLIALFFTLNSSLAQLNSSNSYIAPKNTDSNDAIAVRIVPNPGHLSIADWYSNQGFSGAPQSLIVDGYEAIRDGRTVYVNAANIKGKEIFTNIYLISYNQDPSIKTIDILGQIVKNWKFNTDLKESVSPAPSCRISLSACDKDSDCQSNELCLLNDSSHGQILESHTCQLKVVKNCLTDSDCPQNFFCDSTKAKIIRDIKRISEIEAIKTSLSFYKIANGYYPKLESGSYLAGQTVSVWPSWGNSFLPELSLKQTLDPVNRLGNCPGYDSKTCWNKDTKKFYTSTGGSLVLPASSFAFIYKTINKGLDYDLCATMETRLPTANLNFTFSPNTVSVSNCVVATGVSSSDLVGNTPPRLINTYLSGDTEQEFSGSIVVLDDQNNPLTWAMTSDVNWIQAGWASAPVLKASSNKDQRKIYSPKAGKPGVYPITITVNDGQGGVLSTTTNIKIINPKSFIEAENAEYLLSPSVPFTYTFYFNNLNVENYLTAATVEKISGPASFNLLSLPKTTSMVATGRYKVVYSGLIPIPTVNKFTASSDYTYRISIKDKFGDITTKEFKVTIISESPTLNFNCPSANRSSGDYSCLLGPLQQSGQKITYLSDGLNFAGLKITNSGDNALLSSTNTFFDSDHSSMAINIKAVNQYGASTTKSFNLKIDTFCGDGIKQNPNTEGKGGIYNDGHEDCDGAQGVALTAASSSELAQYACATFDYKTPNPIINNYCVFKSPVDGGGFCGDTYCQVEKENKDNCSQDCLSICVPNCSRLGRDCGDNGCDGTCGDCPIGDECFGGKCCLNEATIIVNPGANSANLNVYFNGKAVPRNTKGESIAKVEHGKNVLAIAATDASFNSLRTSLSQTSQLGLNSGYKNICRDPKSTNLKGWKCSNNRVEGDWSLDYNDANWKAPNSGFYNGSSTIWATDYSGQKKLESVICRYTFMGDNTSTTADCVADSAGKECGSNGCGGNFRPNDCAATYKNDKFVCNEQTKKCECPSKDTCAKRNTAAGVTAGKLGSTCGTFPDRCNGTEDCGAACETGLYCKLPATYESATYLGIKGRGSDYDFISRACNAGSPNNTCQKKCWTTTLLTSVNIRQGDVPEQTKCAVKTATDNPICSDNNPPRCPNDCSTQTLISNGSENDRCYTENPCWGILTCKDWTPRKVYSCSNTVSTTLYYGDICSSSGSKIDNGGNCVCSPSCAAGSCGSNGCGGICNNGNCGVNQKCTNGTCVACTPNCNGKDCGASDGCGGLCSNGACPASQLSCVNNKCECAPNCSGKVCGADDGCGGKCSTPPATCSNPSQTCDGTCVDAGYQGYCESSSKIASNRAKCNINDNESSCQNENEDYKCVWFENAECSTLGVTLSSQVACKQHITLATCDQDLLNKCKWMGAGICSSHSTTQSYRNACAAQKTYYGCLNQVLNYECYWANILQ